eukprot:544451-Pelagomonas_calceolata.AAC.2
MDATKRNECNSKKMLWMQHTEVCERKQHATTASNIIVCVCVCIRNEGAVSGIQHRRQPELTQEERSPTGAPRLMLERRGNAI